MDLEEKRKRRVERYTRITELRRRVEKRIREKKARDDKK
jgi:hypothetical protein